MAFLELDVEDRADDLHDLSGVLRCLLLDGLFCRYGHGSYPLPRASAPDAISSISLVMRDWGALFAASVRSSMRSPAASVALRMATICAENADAFDSRIVWNTATSISLGMTSFRTVSGSGSKMYCSTGWSSRSSSS